MDYHEIPILVSSDVNAGALNKSADGSTFTIILDEPLEIPREAMSVDIMVEEATVWWTIPNVVAGVNDTFYLFEGANFVAVIPQGLYDLSGLEAATERELVAVGAPAGSFNFIRDDATQRRRPGRFYTGRYVSSIVRIR
jgi:hypothetical protein